MLPSVMHASARHRPGSLVGDALSLLRNPAILGSWLHASRLAEMLAAAHAPHRAGKATGQIANELRAKLLPPARSGRYADIEVRAGSLIRAVALAGTGARRPSPACPGRRRGTSASRGCWPAPISCWATPSTCRRGTAAGIPVCGIGWSRPSPVSATQRPTGASPRSMSPCCAAVGSSELYEIETNAGKATKALVRLNDILVTAGQPPGGLVVVVDDRQIDRLRLELQRPTLRPLRGFGRILPFSKVEDPFGP